MFGTGQFHWGKRRLRNRRGLSYPKIQPFLPTFMVRDSLIGQRVPSLKVSLLSLSFGY